MEIVKTAYLIYREQPYPDRILSLSAHDIPYITREVNKYNTGIIQLRIMLVKGLCGDFVDNFQVTPYTIFLVELGGFEPPTF